MENKNSEAKNSNDSIYEKDIQRGISKGIISVAEDKSKIIYNAAQEHKENLKDPEEKVRAAFFGELVLDYGYNPNRIRLEVPVPRRTPEDRADIVVYEDDELKKPYLVVECKKDGITDAEFKQAVEQVFGNANSLRAQFAAVIAGTTRTAFNVADFKPSEREKNVIADIPKKYGKAPKYKFIKGEQQNELKIISKDELIRTLQKSHDTVWQGGRFAPTTAFDEVSKLLFCKLKDENDTIKGEPYEFQIGTHETADNVFNRINGIYQKAREQDAEVFKDDIKLEPKIIYSVVEHLQGISFTKTDLDTKGVAFETFMEDFFKGKMGQFFTPREIIRFAVKMLNPMKDELILDPAAGSGGFLLNSMDNVREFSEEHYDKDEAWNHWHSFARQNLYGIEINDQIARVCKMNMIIHDDGHTNVINTDSLRDFEEIKNIHRGFKKDHFDIILTNPPFGATIKRTEKDYLDKYILGKGKDAQKSEILFIERVISFVKPKTGRIGIVLPDGILTNSSLQYVRDYIMERCQILAVVSLPQFAFSPYGAGVKASLVFLRRKGIDEVLGNYPIFMAITEHIGYDATNRKDPQNDLDKVAEEYRKFLKNPDKYEGV
jgi:type I restriction enzyme M protein